MKTNNNNKYKGAQLVVCRVWFLCEVGDPGSIPGCILFAKHPFLFTLSFENLTTGKTKENL